jgi:ketosteroid isomerase-like protein
VRSSQQETKALDVMERVSEAYYEYADAFDTGDIDRFVLLFATECLFDDSPKLRTHQWIRERATQLRDPFEASIHLISNVRLLSVESDAVRATASAYSWQRRHLGGQVEGWGRYDTLFRLEDEKWRIAHHRIAVVGTREIDTPKTSGDQNHGDV